MPKYTLLELTQKVLSDISGDFVNNITDTEESEQVASIIEDTYWDLIETEQSKWQHLKKLRLLDSVSDVTRPVYLKAPTDVYSIRFIKYNKRQVSDNRDKYENVFEVTPQEFLGIINARDDSQDNVTQITDFSGTELSIRNDVPPTYWTSFDDEFLVFDSFDIEVETTLQSSKTQCHVAGIPTWVHDDLAVPDLPAQAFSLLLSESKSTAWNALKQLPNSKEEQKATRQRANLKNNSHTVSRGEQVKRYGRRSAKGGTIRRGRIRGR